MTLVTESPSSSSCTVGEAPVRVPLLGGVPRRWRRPLEFLTALPAHGVAVVAGLAPVRGEVAVGRRA
ncbi:hypothetical protein LCL61_12230 [Amycolatopsis coloradensis]|uniref:Uncharacterized protein n=1 Tax=Amycolatopsis coloradensis TaxID=76021 RepID=A0ACD5BAE6_9PSEU